VVAKGRTVKVAVTGANGLIGGAAIAQLADGHAVLAIGRGPSRLGAGEYTWADVDLGDGSSLESALRDFAPDAVLHAGAVTDVDGCERDPDLAWRVNVTATEQASRACRAVRARLVAVSTDYVFDGKRGCYVETDTANPRGVYAVTKRAGEDAALILCPGSAVARVAVVFSGRPGAKNTFATQVVEKLTRREQVKAFHDQIVSPTLAENAAEMLLELLLETDYAGILHTCGATAVNRVEFAELVAARFGLTGEIIPVKTADVRLAAPRPLRSHLSTEKAAHLLRHKPLPLDQALDAFHAQWQRRRS
jgi:dTDP-4-dehydrorhamnose reductase